MRVFSIECKIYFKKKERKKGKYLNALNPLNPLLAYFYDLNVRVIRSRLECIFNLFIFKLSILQGLTRFNQRMESHPDTLLLVPFTSHFSRWNDRSRRFDSKDRIASSIVERLQRIRSPFHERAAFVNGCGLERLRNELYVTVMELC